MGALCVSDGFLIPSNRVPRRNIDALAAPSTRAQTCVSQIHSSSADSNIESLDSDGSVPQTKEEKAKAVGNLVENDEWLGLTLELSELVRTAVIEDIKTNAREFLGKDNYEVGDISKEIDSRVKSEVARLRGKEVRKRLQY